MVQTKTGMRIYLARKKAGISQHELGTRVRKSGNQIGRYERGESRPNFDMVKMIAEATGVHVSFIAEYDHQESLQVSEPPVDAYGGVPIDPALRLVPFVAEWDGTWPLPKDVKRWYVHQELLIHNECLITRLGKDDQSMRTFLLPGDAFLVDPHVRRPRSMAVVLVRIGDEVLVRRFTRTKSRQAYLPFNSSYPAVEATGKEKVLGQVVGLTARRLHDPLTFELGY